MIVPSGLAVSRINATDELLVAPEVRATGLALSGLVVAAGTIGLTLELTLIILRFLNIGYVNLKINHFLLTVSSYGRLCLYGESQVLKLTNFDMLSRFLCFPFPLIDLTAIIRLSMKSGFNNAVTL